MPHTASSEGINQELSRGWKVMALTTKVTDCLSSPGWSPGSMGHSKLNSSSSSEHHLPLFLAAQPLSPLATVPLGPNFLWGKLSLHHPQDRNKSCVTYEVLNMSTSFPLGGHFPIVPLKNRKSPKVKYSGVWEKSRMPLKAYT